MKSTPLPTMPEVDPALKALPAPQPGVVISVPIMLFPEYMRLHGYEPNGYQDGILNIKKGVFDAVQNK